MPTTALRFFNIYGPRQALSNPYTGVLAIFSSRYLNDRPPIIFEDGLQRRDFVNVHDVVQACQLALENSTADGQVFNVGSGRPYSILDIASMIGEVLEKPWIKPQISGDYRVGDIRHCYADIDKASSLLGYQPKISLTDGLNELADWLRHQQAEDRVETMRRELTSRGLSV
jgi:dTDP-L-rhamnose 4-epimerase